MNLGPLEGVRVLELCSNVAGPVAGTLLADLGAEVIKIERPEGDDARRYGSMRLGGQAPSFTALNRNKASVVIDFTNADDMAALLDLVRQADVLIHNLRPGVIESIGLGGPEALALNPRLIFGAISGYGSVGPMASWPGYDSMAQGLAGVAMCNGEPDGKPCVAVGGPVDKGSGVFLATVVCSALYQRERTGRGAIIATSLLETALTYVNLLAAQYEASGTPPARWGSRAPTMVPSDCYATKDGFILLTCANDGLFRRLAKALNRPEWLEDPEFASNPLRVANRDRLEALLAEAIAEWQRDELVSLLTANGVPCAPVLGVDEARHHPQVEALGIFEPLPDGSGKVLGPAWTIDGRRAPIRRGPPRLGEDTAAILGRPQ